MPPIQPNQQSSTPPETPTILASPLRPSRRHARPAVAIVGLAGIATAVLGGWIAFRPSASTAPDSAVRVAAPSVSASVSPAVAAGTLDPNHNYGDKYANALLPVGDNKYSLSTPSKGTVFLCHANFVPPGQAGAQKQGPWFTNDGTQWDPTKKTHVSGDVNWTSSFTMNHSGTQRVITTNDLPNHPTGVFPISASDPAHAYDANPNSIKTQSLTYDLSLNPTLGSPQCMGGQSGVMLTGIALFNAFDAGGRDAGAWEVQDGCDGHPQNTGEYHYHTLSSCIKDTSVQTVLGFALDGFPITGPKVGDHNILTTSDLDECHGITSTINLDGKPVTTYHYVMTQDFPYSVSCFRSTAIQAPGLAASPATHQP